MTLPPKRLSKLMSLILRHQPKAFDLLLDPEGYVPLDELVAAIQTRHPEVTRAQVERVVAENEPEKKRFSIVDAQVRANYGHSLDDRIAHPPATPPAELLHGTHASALEAILAEGLRPMARQYVHLTPDREIASRVGGRRGEPVLVTVDAAGAHAAGVVFYRANQTFWLVDALPAAFLRL